MTEVVLRDRPPRDEAGHVLTPTVTALTPQPTAHPGAAPGDHRLARPPMTGARPETVRTVRGPLLTK
jgi:hypothetical protein